MKTKRLGMGTLILAASLMAGSSSSAATDDHHNGQNAAEMNSTAHYLAIQTALAGDSLDQVGEHASALGKLATVEFDRRGEVGAAGSGSPSAAITAAAAQLAGAKDLEGARRAFGDLSEALVRSGALIPAGQLKVAYCPMAGKHWLQTGNEIANPYYGSKMLRCGSFVPRPETGK
ncbi:MAG: hypothetical protein AB7V45_04020 [Candidatus Krumholzibacteriia bacterium]